MIEFRMPSLGADMEAGTLVEWLVKPGDQVKRGDIIALVDTQKGLFDIEVFDEGKVEQLIINEHQKVPVGTVMALINNGKEKQVVKEEGLSEKTTYKVAATFIKASPLARRMAEEKGIDLTLVKGTGEEGAITKADVEAAIMPKADSQKPALKETPAAIEKETPKVEKSLATSESLRMAVAAAMSKSNSEIPHYYVQTEIDMSKALAWLAETNRQRTVKQRLLPIALMIKATARALTEVPSLNASWDNGVQLKEEINIGLAVSLRTGGIMIPGCRNADQKTLDEIMEWINDIIPKARGLRLSTSDIMDTTITISSLNEGSVETLIGVIYPPQVALVSLGGITEKPWAENGALSARPVINAFLCADHRATDGQTGSKFLNAFKNYLQKPESL